MSKRSREKHARPEFVPADDPQQDDAMCDECGFFQKLHNSDLCDVCTEAQHNTERATR
jgi:hypothetical protein